MKLKILSFFLKKKEFPVLFSLTLFFLVFSSFSSRFATLENIASIFSLTAEMGIVVAGITLLMVAGEFDLSVGSTYGMAAVILVFLRLMQINILIAILLALGTACFIGFCNGIITLKAGIPSFITTLGMLMVIRGLIYFITQGYIYKLDAPPLFYKLLSDCLLGNFRISVIWFIIITLVLAVILSSTKYGNWLMAVGGNKEVARMLGVNVFRVKLITFILTSFMAGLSGIIATSRFGMVMSTFGEGMELEAITAAVMGGTLLSGGYGTLIGSFLGTIFISSVKSGLILIGAPAFWYQTFVGIALIIAVIFNSSIARRIIE
jgi:simple sugar transport system permease protein